MRSERKILLGIVLLGLVLRLIRIQNRDIWYDDAFSIFLARQPIDRIIAGTAADTMPPLYYFLLHGWMRLGQSIWLLRSLNVLLSLAVIVLVFRWISELFGSQAGLWASLITAVSPLEVYHAQELRMYVLLTLSLLGYAWFFTRIYQGRLLFRRGWLNWLALVLCGVSAMYSHNLAVFTLIVPLVWAGALRMWRLASQMLCALAAIGISSIPWLVMIPGQVDKIQRAFWTPRPGLVEILQLVIIFVTNLPLPGLLLAVAAVGSLQVILIVVLETFRNHWRDEAGSLLLIFTLLPPSLLFVASYFMRPIFVPRAVMVSSLAFYGLVARVAACGQKRTIGALVGGLMVVLALIGLPYQYMYNQFPRSPFQMTAAVLAQSAGATELVVHDNKLSYFPSAVYGPEINQVFLADAPDGHNDTFAPATQDAMGIFPKPDIETAAGDAKRVKFIVFRTAIQEFLDQGMAQHPVLAWLENHFHLADHQTVNDLEIYEFTR